MRWVFRCALAVVFIGLLSLALIPYLPALKEESSAFFEAWQQARNGESASAEEPEVLATPAPNEQPRRSLVIPGEPSLVESSEDPFLEEVRNRAETDPKAAMAWLQDQPAGQLRLQGMLEVVALWAAEDSENALLWLESNAQGLARLETLNSGVELWAKQDPQAAASWIEGMANDGSKIAAAKALASNWAKTSPDEAVAWVNSLPGGPLRNDTAASLIDSWSQTDPESAAIWALSEAEFKGNSELLNQSIRHYAQQSPEEAETFLRGLTEAYEAPEAITAYARALAETNPAAAMDWQNKLSSEDALYLPENTSIIMQEWSRTDSVAASSWLSQQREGAKRDAAIIGFNRTMLAYEPEAATAWANYISDPQQRVSLLKESIQSWTKSQPQEALEWVKAAELDPDLRTTLASEIGAD